jgi:hypothetical protein
VTNSTTAAQPLDLDKLQEILDSAGPGAKSALIPVDVFRTLIAQARAAKPAGAADTTASASIDSRAAQPVQAGEAVDERSLFEREALRHDIVDDEGLERRKSGEYIDEPAQAAWSAWQVARASPAPVSAQQGAAEQHNAVECDSALRAEPASQQEITRLDVMSLIRENAHRNYMAGVTSDGVEAKYMREIETTVSAVFAELDAVRRCRAQGGDTSNNEVSHLAAKAPAVQDDLSDLPGYRHCGLFELIDPDAPAAQAVDAEAELFDMLGRVHPYAMPIEDFRRAEERVQRAVDLQQPRPVPDQAAIVWRGDLMTLIGELQHKRGYFDSHRAKCPAAASPASTPEAAPTDFVRDDLDALVREYGNAPVIGPGRTRRVVMQDIYRLAGEIFAAPTAGAATASEDAPSEKQAKLRALADRIDPEKLWTVPLMDRDKLSEAGRDRLDAGVMLRRYAEFFGPGRWVLIPPTGSVQFSAGSLEKVAEMAKADLDRKAMRATQQEGGK